MTNPATHSGPRAVIFANGEVEDLAALRCQLQPDDLLIGADGGTRHLLALGLTPRVVLGDLDSLEAAQVQALADQGVEIHRYPVEKDETDLEIALQWALQAGVSSIRIVGGLGGRIDHTLGNLFLLADPRLQTLDVRLEDGRQEALLIRTRVVITGNPGDLVSLLPLQGDAQGVWTEGLYYPLRGERLLAYQSRGVSNVMVTDQAQIELTGGLLLCIHLREGAH